MSKLVEVDGPLRMSYRSKATQRLNACLDALFVNGSGQHATRLLLWDDATKRDLGGWSREAVRDLLKQHFEIELLRR